MAKPWEIKDFQPDKKLRVCLRQILKIRLEELYSYETAVYASNDIVAVHDMRVTARRIQSIMKIFRGCFNKKKYDKHYRSLRTLIESLGSARQCDVFKGQIELFRNSLDGTQRNSVELLLSQKNRERKQAYTALRALLSEMRRRKFKSSFLRFIKSSLS